MIASSILSPVSSHLPFGAGVYHFSAEIYEFDTLASADLWQMATTSARPKAASASSRGPLAPCPRGPAGGGLHPQPGAGICPGLPRRAHNPWAGPSCLTGVFFFFFFFFFYFFLRWGFVVATENQPVSPMRTPRHSSTMAARSTSTMITPINSRVEGRTMARPTDITSR